MYVLIQSKGGEIVGVYGPFPTPTKAWEYALEPGAIGITYSVWPVSPTT